MDILNRLPTDLKDEVISYVPLETHRLHFYLLPMVFYSHKKGTYVCFDIDKTDRSIFKLFKNFIRLRDGIKLCKREWELVYTPWYREKKHDKAVSFTFGCLPRSCIEYLLTTRIFRMHADAICVIFVSMTCMVFYRYIASSDFSDSSEVR